MSYFTLLSRESRRDPWAIEFGSWDLDDMVEEVEALHNQGLETVIVPFEDDDQQAIDYFVVAENERLPK